MRERRLCKSKDKKISGVCGGIAEYFDIDPTLVRFVWALTILFTGAGIVAYIVAAVVMDENPQSAEDVSDIDCTASPDSDIIKGFKPEV